MNAYLDQLLLPGRIYRKIYDPQGILCMVSGCGITFIGLLAGLLVRHETWNGYKKSRLLASSGIALILLAVLLHPFYPINKEIWTTPFNLVCGGISLVLFSIFYLILDVLNFTYGNIFFRVIGLNAITIYMSKKLFNFAFTSNFFFGGLASKCGDFNKLILVTGTSTLEWIFLYYLYRRKLFLRV
jgi:predicted acyltransferase